MSVGWCNECLVNDAVPDHVVEFWLFGEFAQGDVKMPREPPAEWPLADWTKQFTLWRGKERGYVKLPDLLPELWEDELKRMHPEGEHEDTDLSQL